MSEAGALENLNIVDLSILGVVGASALFGAITGMLGLSVRILAVVLGLFLSYRHGGAAQQWIAENFLEGQNAIAWGAGYFGTFMVTLLLVGFIGKQMRHIVKASNMGGLDITGGALLGALRGSLIISLIAVPASYTPITITETWKTSALLPYVFAGVGKVSEWSGDQGNDFFAAINDQMRDLSEKKGKSGATYNEMPSDLPIDGDPRIQSELESLDTLLESREAFRQQTQPAAEVFGETSEVDQVPETLSDTETDSQEKALDMIAELQSDLQKNPGKAKGNDDSDEQQDLTRRFVKILNNILKELEQ